MAPNDVQRLWQKAQAGEQAAIARLLSLVEGGGPSRDAVLERVSPLTGRAHRIGLAGPPGAGKSTLVSQLAKRSADNGARIGVVAVDPTSPRSGGALLGDRVRMNELEANERIFIRSLASRGHGGGLSLATSLVADVLDALGFDPIFLETVGVGQGEIDIVRKAHSVILMLLPGAGDAIQLMKAGILEMADLLVVNKGDREGAEELALLLRSQLEGTPPDEDGWVVPVLLTTAYRGEGVDAVIDALQAHAEHLRSTGAFQRRRRAAIEVQLRQLVERALLDWVWNDRRFGDLLEDSAESVAEHQVDVATAATDLAQRIVQNGRL